MRTETLNALLATLDDAFAQVPRPRSIDACPCCVDEAETATLLNTPREHLTAGQLWTYAHNATLTCGSEHDFRYFLPRILRLSLPEQHPMPCIEITFSHIGNLPWRTWPEAHALQEFFDALWNDVLTNHPPTLHPDELLCSLALAEGSVTQRLSSWSQLHTPAAIQNLAAFLAADHTNTANSGVKLKAGRLIPTNAFWDKDSKAHHELTTWLNNGPAAQATALAFTRTNDPDLLDLLAAIDTRLDI
ncbi:hypothetical protein VMT65_09165 [Nocardia sp. CDC153]|uniref:hypothetical protein n=1 Tax=Nocardia sp. CDC153 TaxID=3112167 RepID=UPI002DBB1F88|nr:hypothetical protein [Nocardia sp. CDC153]MEC3953195.1 hypothetical protein [Nocardia sp. CDC153]